jgi:3-oxoacyl-[acyl-carrier protein] reductase
MDLGIQGRKAIVMASSQGLGQACALALAAEGCEVIVNGRDAEKLEATRKKIQAANPGDPIPRWDRPGGGCLSSRTGRSQAVAL